MRKKGIVALLIRTLQRKHIHSSVSGMKIYCYLIKFSKIFNFTYFNFRTKLSCPNLSAKTVYFWRK